MNCADDIGAWCEHWRRRQHPGSPQAEIGQNIRTALAHTSPMNCVSVSKAFGW